MGVERLENMTSFMWKGMYVSAHMMEALKRYVFKGISPGHFLTAVIENDLREAVGRADDDNIHVIPAFIFILYNFCPADCWGSREKMNKWVQAGGLDKLRAEGKMV